jgi:ubiquinone biosynthesis protein UbiJ
MSAPSDPSANLKGALDRHRVEFMKNELALCFTFSTIAARKYETGNQESAENSMANAEKAYETVIQFLSDRKHSTHLAHETVQEFTAELERLRDRLDGLRERFKK